MRRVALPWPEREDKTNIYNLLNELNNLIVKINFTLEEEENNKINFLDITINKDQEDLRSKYTGNYSHRHSNTQ